ncbi:unnamed protein product [Brassica oleracea var. botrytis]
MTKIAFGTLDIKNNSLLNLSLMHPFEDVRCLNLSKSRFSFLDREEDRGLWEPKFTPSSFVGLPLLGPDLSRSGLFHASFFFVIIFRNLTFISSRGCDKPSYQFLGSISFAGYKSLGRLRNLEILDFTSNKFNNSIFPYLSSSYITYNSFSSG